MQASPKVVQQRPAGLYAGAERRANNLSPSGARPRGTSTPGARAVAEYLSGGSQLRLPGPRKPTRRTLSFTLE